MQHGGSEADQKFKGFVIGATGESKYLSKPIRPA
jgi:hypothetical protein